MLTRTPTPTPTVPPTPTPTPTPTPNQASANIIAGECKEIKESAEAGLAKALPALDAAVKCLSKLDKSQIVEVKPHS